MPTWFFLLAHLAIIAYALIGGVFLAFSDFIMRALAKTGETSAAASMQSVNREVLRWVFMVLFLGLVPVSLLVAGYGGLRLDGPGAVLVAAAGLVYLFGCFAVTAVFNVPMNEALARLDAGSPAAREYWSATYLPRWTFWNTIRAAASTLSALLLLVALTRGATW